MAIFSFLARLGLDTAGFEAGVKRAESAASGLGKNIKRHVGGEISSFGSRLAGAFTVGAVAAFAKNISDMVGDIKDMSELLGISTDDVQRLQIASQEANVPFEKLVGTLQKLEAARAQALSGDQRASSLFAALGIDPKNGNTLGLLVKIFESSQRGANETAAAYDLLGTKLSSIKRVMEELQRVDSPRLISADEIRKIDDATKAVERFWKTVKSGSAGFAGRALLNFEQYSDLVELATESKTAVPRDESMSDKELQERRLSWIRGQMLKRNLERSGMTLEQRLGTDQARRVALGMQAQGVGIGSNLVPQSLLAPQRATNSPSEDPVALLRRIAESNEKTFEAIEGAVTQ